MEVRFTQSARRHRIGRAHALHVINTVTPEVLDSRDGLGERLRWIGFDDRGVELEILGIETEGYLLVIHVMPYVFRRR